MEKEYKAKKLNFFVLLFFTGFFAVFAGLAIYGMVIFRQGILIVFLISSLTACSAILWQLLTRFHKVEVTQDYIMIKNERYYFENIAVSPLREMLVKHKLSVITVKEEYQYSFSIVVRQSHEKPKKFHFESKYYTDFNDIYDTIRQKVKPL